MADFTYLYEPGDPTLVLLHGTGGDEQEMLELGKHLLPRVGYLSPRGKEPENGLNRWFRRLSEGVFDEPNLILRTEELADFVTSTVGAARKIALGFSNGANIAAATLLLRPEVFDAAAILAPMVPLTLDSLPNLEGRPVLMVCGEKDPLVPRANALALATMLETAGASLTLHWHPGGHYLSKTEWNVTAAWLAKLR
jgi:phospholipase/carboxylesterase